MLALQVLSNARCSIDREAGWAKDAAREQGKLCNVFV